MNPAATNMPLYSTLIRCAPIPLKDCDQLQKSNVKADARGWICEMPYLAVSRSLPKRK